MRRKEKLIDHGLIKLFLFALVMLTPFSAWADYYDIAIQYETEESNFHSVLVTENPNDVGGSPTDILGDGTMSYDQENNVLTLNGVNLTCSYNDAAFIYHSGYMDSEQVVTVRLVGSNTVTLGNNSYFFDGKQITFTAADNNASLNIVTQDGREIGIFPDRATINYNDNLAYYSSTSEIKYSESYSLWIGGIQVTDANASNVLSDEETATVVFDASTNTLTLHNATIDMSNTADYPVSSSIATLKVKLLGDNTFTLNTDKPYAFVYTGEETTKTLTFETEWLQDEYSSYLGSLEIANTTETENVANGYTISNTFDNLGTTTYVDPEDAGNMTTGWKIGKHTADGYSHDFVKIWRLEVYDLWIGSGRVISSALEAGQSAGPKYNPVDNTLDFVEPSSYPVKSSLSELVISVNGNSCGINYVTQTTNAAITFQATDQQTSGTLKFVVPAEVANNQINKFTVNCDKGVISGFSSVTIEEPLALRTPATAPTTWDANTTTLVISNIDESNLFGGGDGTEGSPYVISTPLDLQLFADKYNDANSGMEKSCYVNLGADIDCSGMEGFQPIGTADNPFVGTFDGSKGDNNYKISNLTYNAAGESDYAGLFCVIGADGNPGSVSNLTLENCTFQNGALHNGAIAGMLSNGSIENCTVTSCNILSEASQPSCGGIVGSLYGGNITNCTVNGSTITATSETVSQAGGIVAFITGTATVSGCQVTGTAVTGSVNSEGETGNNCSAGIVGVCSVSNGVITISNNKVSGNTTISSADNYAENTCAGAIVGNMDVASLAGNTYEYTVKTSTKNGEDAAVEKIAYEQRALGQPTLVDNDYLYDIVDGAMLANTKKLTINMEHAVEGGLDGYYEPLSDYEKGEFYLVSGQEATLFLQTEEKYSISSAKLSYGSTEEELENGGEEGMYEYTFAMPDENATLNLTYTAKPSIWIGDVEVREDGTFPDYSTASFDAETSTLTLNGINYNGEITSGLDALTIKVTGTSNQVNKIVSLNPAATLTFAKASADAAASLTLSTAQLTDASAVISGFASVDFGNMYLSSSTPYQYDTTNKLLVNAIAEETEELTSATITSETAYPLWIGNTQVTGSSVVSDNITRNGVYEGDDYGITFTAGETNLLQLKRVGIIISESHKPAIVSGLDNLTIQLVDRNEINFTGDYACYMVASAKENATLTFKAAGDDALLTASIGNSQYVGSPANGFQTVSYDNNLVYIAYGTNTQYIKKLDAPTVSLSEGHLSLSSNESIGDNMGSLIMKYSVDYVDASLTDITNETYAEGTSPEISSPCTITAHAEYNGKIGIEATAKYFGFAEAMQVVYEGTAFELTTADLPAIFPAIEDGDDVTYQIAGVSQGTAVTYDEQTQKYMVQGIGTAVLNFNLMQGDNTPYQVLNEVASLTVNVVSPAITFTGSNLWATYYSSDNLAVPDGLTAYLVSSVNETSGEVTATSINYIPANNAVLLKRTDTATESYTAETYTENTSTFTNLLAGSVNETDISTLGSSPVYVLFNDKFKRATSGTIPARRAYLVPGAAVAPAGAPQYLTISIIDGNTTAIDTLTVDDNSNDSWYTIDGLKLNGKPKRKGLYINNGKKVYINSNK